MPKIFHTLEKIKPLYDITDTIVMSLCKLLLVADICIASISVLGRYVPFIPDPSWTEEVVLTLMSYMAVLSAAIAIRRKEHICMTTFDRYLPVNLVKSLDVLSDLAVLLLGLVMLIVGWQYAAAIGSRGTYVSMPNVSRFWMYFPVPLAGIAMVIFELECLFNDAKAFFEEEEKKEEA